MERIPVIDIFAGPGGLSEGFSSARDARGRRIFDVRLSIEKDPISHKTLMLRSLFRSFEARVPDVYYDYVRGLITEERFWATTVVRRNAQLAKEEAVCMTLSEDSHARASALVRKALANCGNWVLIGGPPCQAYSLVGRSRMRSAGPSRFEKDERHYLYREYLRILAEYAPPVFIMENVKGLLSSTVGGQRIFDQILEDLSRPGGGTSYRIVPLTTGHSDGLADDFVVRSEQHGVPQARHRVILCGVRTDLPGQPQPLVKAASSVSVKAAIGDLPLIRSRISRSRDCSHQRWLEVLKIAAHMVEARGGLRHGAVARSMFNHLAAAREVRTCGVAYLPWRGGAAPSAYAKSLRDPKLEGVTAHVARAHMEADLYRYYFAACFALVNGTSPKLNDFPAFLLPKHENARRGHETPFQDRFRVQVYGRPSTTVVSHIAKDGHYFIHPDPAGCRSLTVREAARLQTFPDNYHFEGNRTQQYGQVGNAVPPLLARQIATTVSQFLADAFQGARNGAREVRAKAA